MMGSLEKSTFSPLYRVVCETLVSLRKEAGLTQRELAKRLKREQSFVTRVEQGERRVDLVELLWICQACGAPPEEAITRAVRRCLALGKSRRRS